jgi:hypothetical protein
MSEDLNKLNTIVNTDNILYAFRCIIGVVLCYILYASKKSNLERGVNILPKAHSRLSTSELSIK